MVTDHGTRQVYRRFACRCLPCKAAEAAYRRALYALHQQGKVSLGSVVSSGPLRKQVKALRLEGVSYAEIATRLGIPGQRIVFVYRDRVTLRNLLKVRRLYRQIVAEAVDSSESVDS